MSHQRAFYLSLCLASLRLSDLQMLVNQMVCWVCRELWEAAGFTAKGRALMLRKASLTPYYAVLTSLEDHINALWRP